MRRQFALSLALSVLTSALSGSNGSAAADLFATPPGTVYGQAIGVTAITLGSDPMGKESYVLFSGLLEITKHAATTFIAPDGKSLRRMSAQIDSRLGRNETLGVRAARMPELGFVQIWVDPDHAHPSLGFLTEVPGTDGGQVEGHFELYLVFQMGPTIGQVRNREPVVLSSHLHDIPPVTPAIQLRRDLTPEELVRIMNEAGKVNTWEGVNLPVALYDRDGKIRAWFTPKMHKTMLTGTCGDAVDNDKDGKNNEESPDNIDNDDDGFVDEDSTCPA